MHAGHRLAPACEYIAAVVADVEKMRLHVTLGGACCWCVVLSVAGYSWPAAVPSALVTVTHLPPSVLAPLELACLPACRFADVSSSDEEGGASDSGSDSDAGGSSGGDGERGLLSSSDWEDEEGAAAAHGSSSDDDDDEGAAAAVLAEWGVGALAANPDEQIPSSEVSG
jgi:hypothetical protein